MRPRRSRLTWEAACVAFAAVATWASDSSAVTVTIPASKDNTLYDTTGPLALSNGAGDHLFVGVNATGDKRRALIAFDVAGTIPAGAIITEVTLRLHVSKTRAASKPIRLNRVTADWGEGTTNANDQEGSGGIATTGDATWQHRFHSATPWTTPGGDFVATVSGTANVAGVANHTWTSTELMVSDVQTWLDSPATNFGWILRGDENTDTTTKRFDSRTHPTASFRPVLTVTYTALTPTLRSTWGSIKALYR